MSVPGFRPFDRRFPDLIDSALLGRSRAMRTALSAVRRGGTTIVVTGERGIGKTRFAQEIARQVSNELDNRWVGYHVEPHADRTAADLLDVLYGGIPPRTRLLILDDAHFLNRDEVAHLMAVTQRERRLQVLLTASDDALGPLLMGRRMEPFEVRLNRLPDRSSEELLIAHGVEANTARALAAGVRGNPGYVVQLVHKLRELRAHEGLPTVLGPDGRPLDAESAGFKAVELSVRDTSDALIAHFAESPESMYDMDPRAFEELVAELYSREGFDVELTPTSKDGGIDIYAVQRASFGSFLTVVDCKRYAHSNPVEVGLVRQLYGTVNDLDASMGVIATTSYFTRGAKQLQQRRQHRLGLQDFAAVQDMLKRTQSPG